MDIRKLVYKDLFSMRDRGDITATQLDDEITRRSAFLLGSVLRRFVEKVNADLIGA